MDSNPILAKQKLDAEMNPIDSGSNFIGNTEEIQRKYRGNTEEIQRVYKILCLHILRSK